MTFHDGWTAYHIVNAASGVLFIALGALVGRLHRGQAANRAFAWFAVAFGAGFSVLNLVTRGIYVPAAADAVEAGGWVLSCALFLVAAGALVRLALLFPAPAGRAERRWLAAFASAPAAALLGQFGATLGLSGWGFTFIGYVAVVAVILGSAGLFALRAARASGENAFAYAVMASALMLHPAFFAGFQSGLFLLTNAGWPPVALLVAPPVAVAVAWLVAATRAPDGRRRALFAPAWITLGAMLGGAVAALNATGEDHWGFGVARTLGVLLLAFAIVRGQLPGIDVKVRWTLSKSTVAAAFVSVFFVGSEVAQQFLGEELGSTYVGIAAAGTLVFALAPLQRAAERLAERAVPIATGSDAAPAAARSDKEESYKRALRLALRDRALSREEEVHLHEVAEHMGIGAGRAMALRLEVERDVSQEVR